MRAIVVNYRDITARRLAEAQRAHLAALVQSAQDSIVGLSVDGIVQSWNHGAEALFGYPAHEMLGQAVERVVPDSQRADYRRLLVRVASGEHVDNHQVEVRTIARKTWRATGTPFSTPHPPTTRSRCSRA